jgi:hypothetical protein
MIECSSRLSARSASDERIKQHARAAPPAYAWLAQHLAEILEGADDTAHAVRATSRPRSSETTSVPITP